MKHWTALYVVLKEAVQKLESSRKFASVSITRNLASDARKSLKLPGSVNITKQEILGFIAGDFLSVREKGG